MNKELLLIIYLILGPILDIFAYFDIELNSIIRGLYLLFIIVYLIKNKKHLKLLGLILIFAFVETIYFKFHLDYNYLDTIKYILKFIYLPISILFFTSFDLKKYNKEKVLAIIIFLYLSIYLFCYFFNIGSNVYQDFEEKNGFKGVFNSINEFSGIIIMLLPIVLNYLLKIKKYILSLLLVIFTFLTSLFMGTKVLLLGLGIVIIYLVIINRKKLIFNRSRKIKIIISVISLIILGVAIYLFPKTNTYQNMVIQNKFLKPTNFLEFINKVLFNDRITFLDNNFNVFIKKDILSYLFGSSLPKLVEIDIFDILFNYGIIGFIIFSIYLFKIKYRKLDKIYKFSFILIMLISLTSGHILIYPNVSIYIALLFNGEKL